MDKILLRTIGVMAGTLAMLGSSAVDGGYANAQLPPPFSLQNTYSNRCLASSGPNSLHLEECSGSRSQQWRFLVRDNGLYGLRSVDDGLCIVAAIIGKYAFTERCNAELERQQWHVDGSGTIHEIWHNPYATARLYLAVSNDVSYIYPQLANEIDNYPHVWARQY
ncbi:RICIN domain-containing protein [Nocardia sp. NPDC052566]|uniref:RICIN domain-containing protein n=1 Tax=Nocardia sp. NPDC052566 TaxID=3364330 RepID=UPI0037C4F4A3